MEPTMKKARNLATPPPPKPPPLLLSSLPHVVVDAIFRFVVASNSFTLLQPEGAVLIPNAFASIALVSKEWLALSTQLHSELEPQSVLVKEVSGRRKTIRQRQELTRRRSFVTRLMMERSTYGYDHDAMRFASDTVMCLPHLQDLHLERLYCSSEDLAQLVRLVSRVCPSIQKLVLPSPIPRPEQYEQLVVAVFDGAKKWRKAQSGGLRYVNLPMTHLLEDTKSANTYLDWIVSYCPNIELLDYMKCSEEGQHGGGAPMDNGDRSALWQVDLNVWTRFCETCTNLTHFSWLGVPFATSFFDAFGQKAKPHLKTLTLGTSVQWKTTSYLSEVNPNSVEALSVTGFASTATNALAVVKACPRLTCLTIMAHNHTAADNNTVLMDGRIYDEAFWMALARHCPLLESVVVRQDALHASDSMVITDPAMLTLASLSWLHTVSLDYVAIAGDALFDLVVNHTAASRHERIFEIKQGIPPNEMLFYSILDDFLKRVA